MHIPLLLKNFIKDHWVELLIFAISLIIGYYWNVQQEITTHKRHDELLDSLSKILAALNRLDSTLDRIDSRLE